MTPLVNRVFSIKFEHDSKEKFRNARKLPAFSSDRVVISIEEVGCDLAVDNYVIEIK